MLAKLDRLIEQARAQHAELIAFQNELKPLFAAKAMPEKKRSTGACLRPLPWLKARHQARQTRRGRAAHLPASQIVAEQARRTRGAAPPARRGRAVTAIIWPTAASMSRRDCRASC